MDFADYKAMTFRRDGRVLHAIFNRPERMNSIEDDMQDDLDRLFADVAADPETNVLVLTGAGKAFSAGGDIEAMQRAIDDPDLFVKGTEMGKRLIFSILDCPKPIIAKVNGAAIGLGATIALFCDIVFASERAKIADPHVQVGVSAGDGGAVIWPALIGYARAKSFLFTGDPLTGKEAAEIGLVNKAVPPEDLDRVVDEYAQRLANGATLAIRWTKASINIGLKQIANQVLDAALAWESLSNLTQDHQEAVNAFREKRPPRFIGR